jgi:SAM-dependent methyltransferase
MAREQRVVFGEVAETYDAVRPGYPDRLVDDVLAYAGMQTGAERVLEVGAGTGRATVAFAARGAHVLALEPSAPMAAVARRHCAPYPDVAIEITTFEDWPLRPHAFGLLISAQAWHWVAFDVRYRRAHQALAPGGAIALFWNRPEFDDHPLRPELDAAYARHAPDLAGRSGFPGAAASDRTDAGQELRESGLFADVATHRYRWSERYDAERYLRLMATQSNHRMLPDAQRDALFEAIGAVLERHGDAIAVDYVTELYLGRAS